MDDVVEINVGADRPCLIDRADFELVMKYSWRFARNTKHKNFGYVVATGTKPDGRKGTFSLHRLLLSPPKDKHVDHINGDRMDNRRCNLRLASRSQNMFNMRKSSRGTSKYKGVYWDKNKRKWKAQLCSDRKATHLGFFDDEALAALAFDVAALKARGDFAATNFPPTVVAAASHVVMGPLISRIDDKNGADKKLTKESKEPTHV